MIMEMQLTAASPLLCGLSIGQPRKEVHFHFVPANTSLLHPDS